MFFTALLVAVLSFSLGFFFAMLLIAYVDKNNKEESEKSDYERWVDSVVDKMMKGQK